MITITRLLAREVRAVFSRALGVSSRTPGPAVAFEASPEGLAIWAGTPTAAIQHYQSGRFPHERLDVPLVALKECEGGRAEPVTLEAGGERECFIRWTEKGIPRFGRHSVEMPAAVLPELPARMSHNEPTLLMALHEAAQTADSGATRYALQCIQLRGQIGRIVATDSRQALIQAGFTFPWEGDVLIPASRIFGCRTLAAAEPVEIGRTDDWLALRCGPWTVWLKIEKDARFPDVESIIPQPASGATTLRLTDPDAAFLTDALGRLPGAGELNAPVTVDVNGSVAIRARGEGEDRATELILTGSRRTGRQLRFNTNRHLLARAMQLGFRELLVTDPQSPVLCRDEHRRYVWAVLEAQDAILPGENPIRIELPTSNATTRSRYHQPTQSSRSPTRMTRPRTPQNGSADAGQTVTEARTMTALIEDAEALKVALRDALSKTTALVAGLKRQRQQTRLMRSTLQSLKALQTLDA